MEKTININELQIGMFLDLSSSRLKHDFLSNKFVVNSIDQIAKLKSRNFKEVLIDTEKSINTLEDIEVISHSDKKRVI